MAKFLSLFCAPLLILSACGKSEPVVPDSKAPTLSTASSPVGETKVETKPAAPTPGTDEDKTLITNHPNLPTDPNIPPPVNPAATVEGFVAAALAKANDLRREKNLPELALDEKLAAVAQKHAEDMKARNFFSHTNPDGQDPTARLKASGAEVTKFGENISQAKTVDEAFKQWTGSKPHADMLLNTAFRRQGIGYADGYWSHIFAD